MLADSLSHLLDVVPDAQQPDEPKDHEFQSYCFEELEPAKIFEIISTEVIESQAGSSKSGEILQKLRKSHKTENIVLNSRGGQKEGRQSHSDGSEFCELSENSQV